MAVRRLAYEASDCGLLSPDLAAGIRRVKGARKLGLRVGNWLTVEEGKRLIGTFVARTPKGRRNRAMIAALIGCGLRRSGSCGSEVGNAGWVYASLNPRDGECQGSKQKFLHSGGRTPHIREGHEHRFHPYCLTDHVWPLYIGNASVPKSEFCKFLLQN